MAKSLGFDRVVINSDCSQVVKFVSKITHPWSDVEAILEEVLALEAQFSNVLYKYIPRKENMIVDSIAKEARSLGLNESWISFIPEWIVYEVEYDRSVSVQVA